MPELRLSLAMPFEPRDETLDKDSITTNAYAEQSKIGTVYTVKRPGLAIGFGGFTTTNLGIYYYDGSVYVIDPDDPGTLVGFVPNAPATIFSTPIDYYYEIAGELYGVATA